MQRKEGPAGCWAELGIGRPSCTPGSLLRPPGAATCFLQPKSQQSTAWIGKDPTAHPVPCCGLAAPQLGLPRAHPWPWTSPPPKALGSSATASPPPAHRAGRAGASWEPRAIPHSTAIQPHMPPPTSYCSLHNRAPQTVQQHHSQPQGTTFQPTSGAPPQQPLQHLLSCCTISPCSPHHMGSPSSVAPTNQACCKELPPSPPLPPPNPT